MTLGLIDNDNTYFSRGFIVRINVKVAPMEETALWSVPVTTTFIAHLLMGLVFAKKVKYSININ